MRTDSKLRPREGPSNSTVLALPVAVMLSLLVVIVPVPPVVLDMLLATNITAALVLLLAVLFIRRPLDFSAFPSLLLLTTLARLVLNVASTRLVLTRGANYGTSAAGEVIHTFAKFVAQDRVVVGFVIFCILALIQLLVVTRGASRLSEVAARFALDGMPGRQLAVDADLAAGAITPQQARQMRAEITAQADFHAAMDGAGKFVRGDSIAGILVAFVNLIGGMAIGVIQYHMPVTRAAEVFALLTIGDGLVVQIPSFLLALSAALLATRSSVDSNLSHDAVGQTIQEPAVLFLASVTTLAMVFTGLPALPLLILSLGCALAGEWRRRQQHITRVEAAQEAASTAVKAMQHVQTPPRSEVQLGVEPIELELGFRLIRLADPQTGGNLMDQVQQLRVRIAREVGVLLPKVKIRDNLRLREDAYQIKLRGAAVASGDVQPDGLLVIETGSLPGSIAGTQSFDPVSGRPGKWIQANMAERARESGYVVADASQVLMAHLAEVVQTHAGELLTRQHVHQLLDNLRQTSPKVIDELIPGLLKPSQLHQILANLLQERVPICDLETILESLGDHAERTKDTILLTDHARCALGRLICQPFRDPDGTIHAITLDPALEDILVNGVDVSESGPVIRLTPQMTDGICHELARQVRKLLRENRPAVVVCGPKTRRTLQCITAGPLPKVAILGLNEIPRGTSIRSMGLVPLNAIKFPVPAETVRRVHPSGQPAGDLVGVPV